MTSYKHSAQLTYHFWRANGHAEWLIKQIMTRTSHKNNCCAIIEEENETEVSRKAENLGRIWKHRYGKKILTAL